MRHSYGETSGLGGWTEAFGNYLSVTMGVLANHSSTIRRHRSDNVSPVFSRSETAATVPSGARKWISSEC